MAENFTPASLRRRGAKIPVDIYAAPKGNLQSLVVGKFIDNTTYPLWQIQQWVASWETRGQVEVSQDHNVYYLYFHNPRDWDIFVGQYHTLNFKGSLLILRPWSYTMSYKSINFSATGLWVKAEGIPFILTSEEFATKIFGTAGGVLDIDRTVSSQAPQRFLRARVWTHLGKPLVPGCYIEYEPEKLLWVDFKYEGVFHFCKKCGVIGHTTVECRKSWDEAEQDLNDCIVAYSPPYEVVFGQANFQLYTNKIRGLPNTPFFRTTKVTLFYPPSTASTWYPFTPHSDGRDGESDGESHNDGSPNANTSHTPTPTPSVGENMSTSSDGRDDYGGADQQQHQPYDIGMTHDDQPKARTTQTIHKGQIDITEGIAGIQENDKYAQQLYANINTHTTHENSIPTQETHSHISSTTAWPSESTQDWPEIYRQLDIVESSGSFWSPRTPINYPGTYDHFSLQTGSSSSYHSSLKDFPYNSFENLHVHFGQYQNPTSSPIIATPHSTSDLFLPNETEQHKIATGAALPPTNPVTDTDYSSLTDLETLTVVAGMFSDKVNDQATDPPPIRAPAVLQVDLNETHEAGPPVFEEGETSRKRKGKIPFAAPNGPPSPKRVKPDYHCPANLHTLASAGAAVWTREDDCCAHGKKPKQKKVAKKTMDQKMQDLADIFQARMEVVVDKLSSSAGGLAVFWSNQVNLTVTSKCMSFFHCKIEEGLNNNFVEWNLLLFYGSPYLASRTQTWAALSNQLASTNLPVIIQGDFNQIESMEQKWGGSEYIPGGRAFSNWKTNWELMDIPCHGVPFTWCNNRTDNHRVYERLDRAIATQDWLQLYPEATVINFPICLSDHGPILLTTTPTGSKRRSRIQMNSWSLDFDEVGDIIRDRWSEMSAGSAMYSCTSKIKKVRYDLFRWCQQYKKQNHTMWEDLNESCTKAQLTIGRTSTTTDEHHIRRQSMEEATIKLKFWRQRAKGKWLQLADSNTKFFFRRAKGRKKRNEILLLQNSDGIWVHGKSEVKGLLTQHFQHIYQSGSLNGSLPHWEPPPPDFATFSTLDKAQADCLIADVTDAEVRTAVFQIGSLKAPGYDGTPAEFYQKMWPTVGNDVTRAIKHFFAHGYLLREWNLTLLALIPKVDRPSIPGDFRPISLCNVIYKIISKILANRLKEVLPHLISESQNAFLKGRLLSDNVLLGHELVDYIKGRKKGNTHWAALKVDLNKAYDRVSWDFIPWILGQMQFPQQWIHWVTQCITTVRYSVLINGEASQWFDPQCGLRQGDPLSPYLFLFVMEFLSRRLQRLEETRSITGVKVSRQSPSISHLFFADDSLFTFQATTQSCSTMRQFFSDFGKYTGEIINFDKSLVLFSPNTPTTVRDQCKAHLGTQVGDAVGKYLGNFIEVNGRNMKVYQELVIKMQQKLLSWEHLCLSPAGRLLFANSILASLCTHVFSVYLMPKFITKQLNSLICKFWWKGTSAGQPIYWKKRSLLEQPKDRGGLGLKNVEYFNKALLAKQAWRLHQQPTLLLARVYSTKYKMSPLAHGLLPHSTSRTSWGFRGLSRSIHSCREGFGRTLSNMTELTIGSPGWASGHSPRLRQGATVTQATMVTDLLDQGGGHWKPSIIWSQFTPQSARHILSTHIPNQSATGGFSWKLTGTGTLSSKSAYHLLTTLTIDQEDNRTSSSVWKSLWSSPIPPKWKVFMWRVLWNALPLKSNLNKRGIGVNNMCLLCGDSVETNEHLFRDCSFVNRIWACGNLGIRYQNVTPLPLWRWIMDYLFCFQQQADTTSTTTNTFITTLWSIWNFRNKILFAGLQPTPTTYLQLMAHYDWELTMFIHQKTKTATPYPSLPHSIRVTRGGCPTSSSPHLIIDGAWKLQQNGTQIAGIGWVLVNSDTQTTTGSEPIIAISPLQAETKALLSGIQASTMEGITDLRVFTDCSTIGNLILKRQPGPPEIQTLLQSLEEAISSFHCFQLSVVPRTDVVPAHILATQARDRSKNKPHSYGLEVHPQNPYHRRAHTQLPSDLMYRGTKEIGNVNNEAREGRERLLDGVDGVEDDEGDDDVEVISRNVGEVYRRDPFMMDFRN
ncbi:LINE-1 retrotransposable element ORF2 protein [Bienertia sinuspersici]